MVRAESSSWIAAPILRESREEQIKSLLTDFYVSPIINEVYKLASPDEIPFLVPTSPCSKLVSDRA
jgi:hypothetical protein